MNKNSKTTNKKFKITFTAIIYITATIHTICKISTIATIKTIKTITTFLSISECRSQHEHTRKRNAGYA